MGICSLPSNFVMHKVKHRTFQQNNEEDLPVFCPQNFTLSPSVLRVVRRHPKLNDFRQYVERTYIGPNAIFRPPMWNVYDRIMDVRTNNSVER